jgi:hypothetical protein
MQGREISGNACPEAASVVFAHEFRIRFAKKGDSSVGEPGCGEKATLGAALQRAHCKNNEFTMVGNFACNTSHMRWRSAADNNEYQCEKQ